MQGTQSAIQQQLYPDEQLLWIDKPDPTGFTWRKKGCLIPIICLAVFATAYLGAFGLTSLLDQILSVGLDTEIFITLFILIIIGLCIWYIPRFDKEAAETAYAITTHRILIFRKETLTSSFTADDIEMIEIEKPDREFSTIYFAKEIVGSAKGSSVKKIGLIAVPNPKQAAEHILALWDRAK